MSPVTHFLTGWVLANSAKLNRRERAAVTIAAVIPDVDGLGAIAELATRHSQHPVFWFSQYHHAFHTLLVAIIVTAAVSFISDRKWLTAALALLAFHIHLLEDLVGSRGPDGYAWPIHYLAPFTNAWTWTWSGQWALNTWPNFAITLGLLVATLWLAIDRGVTPVELFSATADRKIVEALRNRLAPAAPVAKPVK